MFEPQLEPTKVAKPRARTLVNMGFQLLVCGTSQAQREREREREIERERERQRQAGRQTETDRETHSQHGDFQVHGFLYQPNFNMCAFW